MRLLALCVLLSSAFAQNFTEVRPSPQQLAWQELEIGVLIHFGTNTFQDREWGDGTADPKIFHPTQLDAEQWVKAARAAGASYLILVAKHHDGFALWPSRHTDFSVKRSPWRDGKGDLVREVSDACRKHGLRFGVYLSPWDRHEPSYADSKKYDEFYSKQLVELATRYGPLTEFWLDGAGSEGHVYDFMSYIRTLRTYQPNVLLFASLDLLPYADIRWVGNEDGSAPEENWNVIDGYNVLRWRPAEADTPLRKGHWFWHPNAEAKLKSLDELMETYHATVGRGAQLVLGLAPDNRGLMPDVDVKRLAEFGAELKRLYGWESAQPAPAGSLDPVHLQPGRIDRVVIQEDLTRGQMIRRYSVTVRSAGVDKVVARGTTIGHKRIHIFPAVDAEQVRLNIELSLGEARIRRFTAHLGR
jgi:alpha-L-fucosidase